MFGIGNRNRLLQPFASLGQFAQELYAMSVPGGPVDRSGPVTLRPEGKGPALTIAASPDQSSAPEVAPPIRARPAPNPVEDVRRSFEAGDPAPRRVSSLGPPAAPRNTQLVVEGDAEFQGENPVRFSKPPEVYNPKSGNFEKLTPFDHSAVIPSSLGLSGGGGADLFARVTGGSGHTWRAQLLKGGPAGSSGGDTIEVYIPYIADDELAPVGFVICGLCRHTGEGGGSFYSYQPPVWMS